MSEVAVVAPDLWRKLAERFLAPWYDRDAEQARLREADDKLVHSEEVRKRAIAARINLENVRRLYLERLEGRR